MGIRPPFRSFNISLLLTEMRRITPDEDTKLATLKTLIQEKIDNPINEGNRKISHLYSLRRYRWLPL